MLVVEYSDVGHAFVFDLKDVEILYTSDWDFQTNPCRVEELSSTWDFVHFNRGTGLLSSLPPVS